MTTMRPDASHLQPTWLDAQRPREGRFVLGPLLGQGGVGEVREAWDVVLCRTVALKVLRKMDPGSLIRFMHEARLHSRLVHPNICQIFDVDSSEGAPRIAMQLVRGPTLADAAATLSLDEIVQILALVADAVHAAHRQKLIHRDLKPSNILLERGASGTWIPYVCDFGLAMEMDAPTLTAPHWVHGTPAYMAPEQIRGDRALIGPATDVFALGGTLCFALNGRPPRGPVIESPVLGSGERRLVPRDLDSIARKCMEPDPRLRYPTASALAEDLWRFRNGEPILARPPGLVARHWQRWRRTWKLGVVATLAAGALCATLLLAQRQMAENTRRRASWQRFMVLEATSMERDLSLEKALPVHDLRPAYEQIRVRLREIEAQLQTLGADAQGPGHYALGRDRLLLGDWPEARRELEQAAASGFNGPDVAGLLAQALTSAQIQAELETQFSRGTSASSATAVRVEDLVSQGAGLGPGPGAYGDALAAFLRKQYARAAERARMAIEAQPWRSEPAALASLSLGALGRKALEAGDDLLAEARFVEAMEIARTCLERVPGDEAVHHAYLLAARGLASLRLERDQLSPAFLESLQRAGEKAFRLNPGNPDLLDDRLLISILKARRLAGQGTDPGPELEAALQLLSSWAREPLSAGLRADRMLIHWLRSEWAFRRGADPAPALAEALRDPGHTPFLGRDYLGDIMNFKARVEAARGEDPRPTLEQALARLQPLLGPGAPRSLCATAAQTWLIRSRWEAAHGIDPSASLQRSSEWFERAQIRHPRTLGAAIKIGMGQAGSAVR